MLGQLFAQWYLLIGATLLVVVAWLWFLGRRPGRSSMTDLQWKLVVLALMGGGGIAWLERMARHTLSETPPEHRQVELDSILTWAPMIASATVGLMVLMTLWGSLRKERTDP